MLALISNLGIVVAVVVLIAAIVIDRRRFEP